MAATPTVNLRKSVESIIVKQPPVHPTYDLKGVIKLALSEDAGDKAGGVSNALKSVDLYLDKNNLQMGVEVETRTFEEIHEVLNYASENKTLLSRIMLDDMVVPQPDGDVDVSMLKEAVELINGKFETEASGNVTLETVQKIGQIGVTYIYSGALTHSVKALDISLKIDTELALKVGRRTKRA